MKEMFKDFVAYLFEIDENGDVTSFSQLDAFIRGVKEVLQLVMEIQNWSLWKESLMLINFFFWMGVFFFSSKYDWPCAVSNKVMAL